MTSLEFHVTELKADDNRGGYYVVDEYPTGWVAEHYSANGYTRICSRVTQAEATRACMDHLNRSLSPTPVVIVNAARPIDPLAHTRAMLGGVYADGGPNRESIEDARRLVGNHELGGES